MKGINISFYLRNNQIRIYSRALREIGSPDRICFLMNKSGDKLILVPYSRRDLKSHHVPDEVYSSHAGMRVCSKKLCRIIASLNKWDSRKSYTVEGEIDESKNFITFNLCGATEVRA